MQDATVAGMIRTELNKRQQPDGGWGYYPWAQAVMEPTCLALLARGRDNDPAASRAIDFFLRTQNADGSWPAFAGDDAEGCWVTALVLLALHTAGRAEGPRARATRWLLNLSGREGHWLWRWKFRLFDTKVVFNPDKYGWPWFGGTVSWVIPTAFALIALRKTCARPYAAPVLSRTARGSEMLADRMCPGGGWNAGNSVVFGVPLDPYVDATAIALLALAGGPNRPEVALSFRWLRAAAASCDSPSSLAWAVLALSAHSRRESAAERLVAKLLDKLGTAVLSSLEQLDSATLATACLALQPYTRSTALTIPL